MNGSLSALPEICLAGAAMLLLLVGAFRGEGSTRLVSTVAVLALGGVLVLCLALTGVRTVVFNGMFVSDRFASFMKTLVLIGSAVSIILSVRFNQRQGMARFEYPLLILFSTVGMMMMISANDLISLYVGLELSNLALYVVAAFRRDSARSSESGLKYFVLGALSSGMLLYGASLIYGFAGTTNFDQLAALFSGGGHPQTGLVLGLVFLLAGLAFKIAAVPFHMWTPDVYEGAPTPVTAFFNVAPNIAAMALFVRVLIGPFGNLAGEWRQIVEVISILSMALGSFAAISQTNIKRLMAYSAIGNVGYALIGLAAGTPFGVTSVLVYMAVYMFTNLGCFTVILCMQRRGKMLESIDDLAGLSRTQPMMALAFAAFMFSMAGIPPVAGFFSKLFVFQAAIDKGLIALAIIGVVTSVVGAFYYLRVVKIMYFDEPAQSFDRVWHPEMSSVLLVSTMLILLFFIFPSPVMLAAQAAAATLFP